MTIRRPMQSYLPSKKSRDLLLNFWSRRIVIVMRCNHHVKTYNRNSIPSSLWWSLWLYLLQYSSRIDRVDRSWKPVDSLHQLHRQWLRHRHRWPGRVWTSTCEKNRFLLFWANHQQSPSWKPSPYCNSVEETDYIFLLVKVDSPLPTSLGIVFLLVASGYGKGDHLP